MDDNSQNLVSTSNKDLRPTSANAETNGAKKELALVICAFFTMQWKNCGNN